MSLYINNKQITAGDRPTFNSTPLTQIKVNGTEVWHYDNTAPTITITSANAATTRNATYTVTGTVTDTESGVASVTVNGSAVTLQGTYFSKAVNLNYGINTITVVAKDKANNSRTVSVTAIRVNGNVITWPDAMTMNVAWGAGQYVSWSSGGVSGPTYTGNRESNNCSVTGSSWASRGQNEYVADSCWATQSVQGRIYPGAKTITIASSRSWQAEGNNTIALPTETGKIYNAAGNLVLEIGNGTTNISSYSDGTYYYDIYRGSGSYGAWEGGSCSSQCTVTIAP